MSAACNTPCEASSSFKKMQSPFASTQKVTLKAFRTFICEYLVHRTMEWFRLEGMLQPFQFQTPASGTHRCLTALIETEHFSLVAYFSEYSPRHFSDVLHSLIARCTMQYNKPHGFFYKIKCCRCNRAKDAQNSTVQPQCLYTW